LHVSDAGKPVGFGAAPGASVAARAQRVTEKELIDYGLLAEFLGRLPVRVELEQLSEEDLFLVMNGPPDAVVREYQALLKLDGVELKFTEGALRLVARHCIRRRTGARSLRTIVEGLCHDVMFDAPERKGETVVLDVDYVAERLESDLAV
jgi:ATP-dependent Clp protease ATP-binding subunit ClpX